MGSLTQGAPRMGYGERKEEESPIS
jgi:hypothetical protein